MAAHLDGRLIKFQDHLYDVCSWKVSSGRREENCGTVVSQNEGGLFCHIVATMVYKRTRL